MDLAVIAIAFGAIFIVELPDKTFIAALVLSTRYKPWAVWLGVGAAFFIQTLIAVTVGQFVTFLPEQVVQAVTAVIFLIGAIVLFHAAPKADAGEAKVEEGFATQVSTGATTSKSGWGAILASFLVLFAAEWGDLSQLITISLVGRYEEPVSVFLGAWAALLTVSGLAIVAGRFLLKRIKLRTIHYCGAGVCLVLEAFTLYELFLAN